VKLKPLFRHKRLHAKRETIISVCRNMQKKIVDCHEFLACVDAIAHDVWFLGCGGKASEKLELCSDGYVAVKPDYKEEAIFCLSDMHVYMDIVCKMVSRIPWFYCCWQKKKENTIANLIFLMESSSSWM
jgi:hypothetical protein